MRAADTFQAAKILILYYIMITVFIVSRIQCEYILFFIFIFLREGEWEGKWGGGGGGERERRYTVSFTLDSMATLPLALPLALPPTLPQPWGLGDERTKSKLTDVFQTDGHLERRRNRSN